VLAHGIGTREDLPLPLAWAVAGAATAVLVSFVALAVLWPAPALDDDTAGRPLPPALARLLDSAGFRAALAGAGLVAFGWTLLALLLGPDDTRNAAPFVIYVLLWVWLVPVSAVLGPLWRRLNPLRTAHRLLNLALRLDPRQGVLPLPERAGWWPSAVGLAGFAWLELVSPEPAARSTLQLAVALYLAVQLLAGLLYGSAWFDRGDAVETWSGLYGRISPVGRRRDGRLVLRRPLAGLGGLPTTPPGSSGLAATAVVMLSATVYDGLSGSSAWVAFAQRQSVPRELVGTAGLLGTIAVLGLLYAGCTLLAGVLGGLGTLASPAVRVLPGAFAPSVVPVACGYVIAHYYAFGVLEGQHALVRLTDPLGIGANWLGTAGLPQPVVLVTPAVVADVMVAAIVLGHVAGVVLAHDRAVRLFPRRAAVLGQLPLLALMVTLTCLGLFLLFWT